MKENNYSFERASAKTIFFWLEPNNRGSAETLWRELILAFMCTAKCLADDFGDERSHKGEQRSFISTTLNLFLMFEPRTELGFQKRNRSSFLRRETSKRQYLYKINVFIIGIEGQEESTVTWLVRILFEFGSYQMVAKNPGASLWWAIRE